MDCLVICNSFFELIKTGMIKISTACQSLRPEHLMLLCSGAHDSLLFVPCIYRFILWALKKDPCFILYRAQMRGLYLIYCNNENSR